MLFVLPQDSGQIIQRNALKILIPGSAILRDDEVGVVDRAGGIGIFNLHLVSAGRSKVRFNAGHHIVQCLAQDGVDGKSDVVGVLHDCSFAVEDRLLRVCRRKSVDQTAENQPGQHQNKQDRQQKQSNDDGDDLADMLAPGPNRPGHSPIGTAGGSALGRAGNRLAGLDGALDRMRCGGRSVYRFSKAVLAFFSHQILSFRLGVGGSFFTMDSL